MTLAHSLYFGLELVHFFFQHDSDKKRSQSCSNQPECPQPGQREGVWGSHPGFNNLTHPFYIFFYKNYQFKYKI